MGMIGNYMGAALGKSVSDFGGVMMQDELRKQDEQRKNAYEELRDQKKIELSERLDKLRRERDLEDHGKKREQDAEFADKKTKATQERLSKEADEVSTIASEIGKKRDVGGLINIQSQIAGDSPNATSDELADALEKNRATYEKAGYVKPKTAISEADDQIAAAKGRGYYDTAKSLSESRSMAVKERDTQTKAAIEERKLEQKDALVAVAERRADALMQRIVAGPKGGDDTGEWIKVIGEQRKGVSAELMQLRADKKLAVDAALMPEEKAAIIKEFDGVIKNVTKKYESIDEKIDAVTSRLQKKLGAPEVGKSTQDKQASSAVPDGYTVAGKDKKTGKSVYKDKNGNLFTMD